MSDDQITQFKKDLLKVNFNPDQKEISVLKSEISGLKIENGLLERRLNNCHEHRAVLQSEIESLNSYKYRCEHSEAALTALQDEFTDYKEKTDLRIQHLQNLVEHYKGKK